MIFSVDMLKILWSGNKYTKTTTMTASPSEVLQGLLDGELPVEGELLRHVADPGARDPGLPGARGSSKDQDTAAIYQSLPHDALQ